MNRFPRLSWLAAGALSAATCLPGLHAATATLLDVNFNSASTGYAGWGSTALTGAPGAGVSTIYPLVSGSAGFDSGLFPTAPTSGYLMLAPNASAVTTTTYFGGWAANVTLPAINSPYTAGGLGQTDLSKISYTARIRARGMPVGGAVVILELRGSGDNPNIPTAGYKRIRFEPIFLDGNDWTTVGGTLDTAGLTAAKGSTYAFPINSAQYTPIIEVSGFNRFGVSGYVAYNTPTGTSNGGRKNPGFGFTGGIRVEVDDVRLVVTDPATTGYIASTTPAQLLRNGNFNTGDANWTFFEGAYVASDPWSEDGSMFALIPGWSGSPYAGFLQSAISVNPANGEFFTATFRAKFDANYKADRTLVAFMNGSYVNTFLEVDITDDIAPRLGQWATYTVNFRATPAQVAEMAGSMSLKIQPIGRTVGAELSSVLIDNVVLSQATASSIGPQVVVKVGGASRADGDTATLFNPVTGRTTPYTLRLENQGGENLVISNLGMTGTGFALAAPTLPITLAPGETRSLTITASPTALGALAGSLTITSNDKEVADQSFVVNLAANAVYLSDTFDVANTTANLGWYPWASTTNLGTVSTLTVGAGALELHADSSGDDYPWAYIASKQFASPGPLDLASSSLTVSLRAFGIYPGLTTNKVQVRLESINAAGNVTGRIDLGSAIDETTAGAAPGAAAYFLPDGTNDRVAVLLPEGGTFTTVGGNLATTGVNTGFDPNAPAFRVVVHMTDFDFDLDNDNIVEVDAINLTLGTRAFAVSNGSFESNATDPGTATAPTSWSQFPVEGVSKNIVTTGDFLYDATLGALSPTATFTAYAGTKALKVYGQNYYAGGIWVGPSQTGTVYQEFPTSDTTALAAGAVLHARAVARTFAVDPLTGGSTFSFGFKFLDASNVELSRAVTTWTAANASTSSWKALVANGTVPAGTAKVQLISEFVQNAATDGGSVYLDDVSVGLGSVAPTVTVGATEYTLAWSDEFDGNTLNSANWTPELGNGTNGWGNNEVQSYTDSTDNLRVANGSLVIEARKTGSNWTSARIKTQAKRSFRHGKIEFRAKLPSGLGPWPAAWMMGENISSVGWPACGEIDVMEWGGLNPNVIGHATHGPSHFGGGALSASVPVSNLSSQFHTYAVVWAPGTVTFSVDGVTTATWSTADTGSPFENEFFLLLNLAIGGNYVGNQVDPGLTSALYEVDYVRVYQAPAAPPLTAYQTYLQSRGLPTDTAFDSDVDGDGIAEGFAYAFGATAPKVGSGGAVIGAASGNVSYTFDLRNDPTLIVTPQTSTNLLTGWTNASSFTLTDTTGAADGFVRKVLTLAYPGGSLFLRLAVTQ